MPDEDKNDLRAPEQWVLDASTMHTVEDVIELLDALNLTIWGQDAYDAVCGDSTRFFKRLDE